jgi:phosphate/phosphite/phosphonate ABC transporters, periplasmic binding protein
VTAECALTRSPRPFGEQQKSGMGRWGLYLGLVLAAVSMAACKAPSAAPTGAQAKTLAFAVLPAERRSEADSAWGPLLNDLSRDLGLPVTSYAGHSYDDLVSAIRSGRVQVGWFAALPAVEAIDSGDAELVARTMNAGGQDSYRAILVVRKGSGLTLEDVLRCGQRYTFGMGEEGSTSGQLAPMAFLFSPRGIDPQRCFSFTRTQNHHDNVANVAQGILDVASVNNVALANLTQREPSLAAQLEVIWRSPEIPGGAILAATDLDPATREKVRSFFLTYGQGEGPVADRQRAVLAGLGYSRFGSAEPGYFDPVREMMADQALEQAREAGDQAAATKAEQELRRLRVAREVQP